MMYEQKKIVHRIYDVHPIVHIQSPPLCLRRPDRSNYDIHTPLKTPQSLPHSISHLLPTQRRTVPKENPPDNLQSSTPMDLRFLDLWQSGSLAVATLPLCAALHPSHFFHLSPLLRLTLPVSDPPKLEVNIRSIQSRALRAIPGFILLVKNPQMAVVEACWSTGRQRGRDLAGKGGLGGDRIFAQTIVGFSYRLRELGIVVFI